MTDVETFGYVHVGLECGGDFDFTGSNGHMLERIERKTCGCIEEKRKD